MKITSYTTINDGLVVEYTDNDSKGFVNQYHIRVTKNKVHILNAEIYAPSQAKKFSEAMNLAMAQFYHLQNNQTRLEQS